MKLTLNISLCPNDTFMFDALVNGRIDTRGLAFDVSYADIEELNRTVMTGGVNISKISYAILPAIHDRYRILDSGSALGRGNGPLLVARDIAVRQPTPSREQSYLFELPRREGGRRSQYLSVENVPAHETPHAVGMRPFKIAIPGEHTTANLLLKRLYPTLTDRTPVLFSDIAPAVASGRFDAGVLIHEGRFTYRDHGLTLIADLGAEWEKTTGLPLPLGAIVVSRDLSPDVQTTVEELLRESIRYAFAHPDASRDYVKSNAQEMADDVIESHIRLFVNDYSLALGPLGRRAVHELTGINTL